MPGHPRLEYVDNQKKDVDTRDKRGHDAERSQTDAPDKKKARVKRASK
jgi:hypothetical protein